MPGCCCLIWRPATCSVLLPHRAQMASGVCMLVLASLGMVVPEQSVQRERERDIVSLPAT